MGLRTKILSGFLILAVMLLVAGVWSVLELQNIGLSVGNLLENNYKSINAAKSMKEALEREDSALLLMLLGKSEEGEKILSSADSSFNKSYKVAKNNITIEGEEETIKQVEKNYAEFSKYWRELSSRPEDERNLDYYFSNIHGSFNETVNSLDKLLNLNDETLYKTSVGIQSKSRRAIMPGIIAIIAAVVFTLLFTYFINGYVITPIIIITNGIKNFVRNKVPFDYTPETKDEIAKLSNEVTLLISYVDADRTGK